MIRYYLKSMLIAVAVLSMVACSTDSPSATSEAIFNDDTFVDVQFSYTPFEREVLAEVNRVREEAGLNTLELVNTISVVALEHNEHMMEADEICHHNYQQRVNEIKNQFDALGVGENIAYGEATAETVVQAWLDSDGHRDNVLHESYTHFGISITQADEDNHYYTNIFAIK